MALVLDWRVIESRRILEMLRASCEFCFNESSSERISLRPFALGRFRLLGFRWLLLQPENDVYPKKKRDEDDLLRFSFYLVFFKRIKQKACQRYFKNDLPHLFGVRNAPPIQ